MLDATALIRSATTDLTSGQVGRPAEVLVAGTGTAAELCLGFCATAGGVDLGLLAQLSAGLAAHSLFAVRRTGPGLAAITVPVEARRLAELIRSYQAFRPRSPGRIGGHRLD
jgi:hypothetical protein